MRSEWHIDKENIRSIYDQECNNIDPKCSRAEKSRIESELYLSYRNALSGLLDRSIEIGVFTLYINSLENLSR